MKAKRWIKITVIILIVVTVAYLCVYHLLKKEIKERTITNLSDKYYLYDKDNVLDVMYGVTSRYEIKNMISFYGWKLKGTEYIYDDISVISKIPLNTIVYPQKYLKDSTIVYVTYKHYNAYRKDTVLLNVFVPQNMIHLKPLLNERNK